MNGQVSILALPVFAYITYSILNEFVQQVRFYNVLQYLHRLSAVCLYRVTLLHAQYNKLGSVEPATA